MKKIRIKICGFDEKSETTHFGFFLLNILNKYFNVELSETPDYIFFNDTSYEHLKYDAIKIWYTGENVSPNFNLCDYAIGCDYMNFEDRYFRLPVYVGATFYNPQEIEMSKNFELNHPPAFTKNDLKKKNQFCSFVYSNYLADNTREIFFDKLSAYKKVNAGGRYLNNVGGRVNNKLEFELQHKFSIAFENSSRSGYTTEKIITSFVAQTIPIYWGNPNIGREFNTGRFINCHDFDNFDEVVNRIKEIDADDSLYVDIMSRPIFADGYSIDKVKKEFEEFLVRIFNQPLAQAKRNTINPMHAIKIIKNEALIAAHVKRKSVRHALLTALYQPFKNNKTLQRLKVKYLKKYS